MSCQCFLDLFPVEILHNLFTYFLAHEILLSFTDLSNYINDVLLSYSNWQLNFKSIRRDHFDLVCYHIQPEKVISLILSDDIDTPGQSELFFSRFHIEQFIHLQFLTLIKIEYESLKNIFFNLNKLKQLKSLSFELYSITHKYLPSCNSIGIQNRQLRTILFDSYIQILPRLNRLYLSDACYIRTIKFLQLHHLKLAYCQYDELKDIIQHAPFLESLNVRLELDHSNMQNSLASSQLIRLHLTIMSKYFYIC